MQELEALQNAATQLNLTIHEKFTEDKRNKVKKYFAQKGNTTVSPTLPYNELNMFLLGWIASLKHTIPAPTVEVTPPANALPFSFTCRRYTSATFNALPEPILRVVQEHDTYEVLVCDVTNTYILKVKLFFEADEDKCYWTETPSGDILGTFEECKQYLQNNLK